MRQKWMFFLCCLMLIGVSGCDATDGTGLKIDLSQINWQTGIIAALLLWIDKSSLWSPFAKSGQPVVNLLRTIGLIRKTTVPDATPDTLTSAEALQVIVDLINRTQHPGLKQELIAIIPTAADSGGDCNGK